MPPPSVTVLLPTFRRPALLSRALRSVLAQTFTDFQVMVCDNSSNDGTAEVVEGFAQRDARVAYHCHPVNIGAQANFGWGFEQVGSEFFCLFSDDDLLLPRCLVNGVEGLRSHPSAMAWGGQVLTSRDDGAVECWPSTAWPEGYVEPVAACSLVCHNIRPANTGMLFRRRVLDPDFHPGYTDFHCSDVLWMLHAAAKGGIGVTREPVAVFTQHAGSLSTRAGQDPETGMALYWPSVRYLYDHFPRGQLSEDVYVGFRRAVLRTYGSEQFWQLGRMAAIQGLPVTVAACIRRLEEDFLDRPGARRLRRLSAIPSILLRAYFGLRYRLLRRGDQRSSPELQRIVDDAHISCAPLAARGTAGG